MRPSRRYSLLILFLIVMSLCFTGVDSKKHSSSKLSHRYKKIKSIKYRKGKHKSTKWRLKGKLLNKINRNNLRCFRNSKDAANQGTRILESFWKAVLDTDCSPKEIGKVYDVYFRANVHVQDKKGASLTQTLEELKQMEIGQRNIPGSVAHTCVHKQVFFRPSEPAFVEPQVFHDFVWIGERVIKEKYKPAESQARHYMIEFAEKPTDKWKNKGKSSKSSSDCKQCQHPQIYNIVLLN